MSELADRQRASMTRARGEMMRQSAIRAIDDPAQLARAVRIVRAALDRQLLRIEDLEGDIIQPSDLGPDAA